MDFQTFLKKYNGQKNVGNTPENKGECVGLVSVYQDSLNVPHEWGNAKDLLVNADKDFFTVIPNTALAVPDQGDIVVWSGSYNNGLGHTGIATGSGDIATFECFEQNDPLGSNCHLKLYDYNFVDGWLKFNHAIITQENSNQLVMNDQTIIPNKLTGWITGDNSTGLEIQQIRGLLGDFLKCRVDLQNTKKELSDLQKQLDNALTMNDEQARKIRDLIDQNDKQLQTIGLFKKDLASATAYNASKTADNLTVGQLFTMLINKIFFPTKVGD